MTPQETTFDTVVWLLCFLDKLPGFNGGVACRVSVSIVFHIFFHDFSMTMLVMTFLSASVRVATAATGVGAIFSPT